MQINVISRMQLIVIAYVKLVQQGDKLYLACVK